MACVSKVYKIQAANAFFGRRHKTCIDFEKTTAIALDGTSFVVSDLELSYQVWFNVDAASTAPTPVAGETLVEVGINSTDNYMAIANAVKAALDLLVETDGKQSFYTEVEGLGCLCIETFKMGVVFAESADVDTALPLTTEKIGSYCDLGCMAEDFELTVESTKADITCHQFGETPIDQIVTGMSSEVELGLLDCSQGKFRELIGNGIGNVKTPVGGTELIGMGSKSLGKSAFDIGGELRFIPIGDPEQSYVFSSVVANFNSISFSAVEKQVMNVTFSVLLDQKVCEELNFFYRGLPDQNTRA